MATAPDDMTPEQQERRRQYAASHAALQARLKDPEFVATIDKKLAELAAAPRTPVLSREAFLAATEPEA